jgi:hypothetical protein
MEAIIHRSRTTPRSRSTDLRNGSHRKGERETHLQNNIKTNPKQLKLSKTDMSMWT